MIETGRLSLGILITAAVLLIIAAATSSWGCGYLYTHCQDNTAHSISTVILYTLGLCMLAVVIILDFIHCINGTVLLNVTVNQLRIVFLFLAAGCIITALLVFTSYRLYAWSYMMAIVGGTLLCQVIVLALMGSSCVTTTRTERIIVRH